MFRTRALAVLIAMFALAPSFALPALAESNLDKTVQREDSRPNCGSIFTEYLTTSVYMLKYDRGTVTLNDDAIFFSTILVTNKLENFRNPGDVKSTTVEVFKRSTTSGGPYVVEWSKTYAGEQGRILPDSGLIDYQRQPKVKITVKYNANFNCGDTATKSAWVAAWE